MLFVGFALFLRCVCDGNKLGIILDWKILYWKHGIMVFSLFSFAQMNIRMDWNEMCTHWVVSIEGERAQYGEKRIFFGNWI